MAYVGGRRARLIKDNLFYLVRDSLEELGWLNGDTLHLPVTVLPEPLDHDEEAMPNIVTISEEFMNEQPLEMGSDLSEKGWDYVIDVYGENQAVAKEIATDIYDVLRGKFTSLGRKAPILVVKDLTQATPSEIFTCELEDFFLDRNRNYTKSFQKHWWMVFVTVVDSYENEDD